MLEGIAFLRKIEGKISKVPFLGIFFSLFSTFSSSNLDGFPHYVFLPAHIKGMYKFSTLTSILSKRNFEFIFELDSPY